MISFYFLFMNSRINKHVQRFLFFNFLSESKHLFLHMKVKDKDKDPKGLVIIEQEITIEKEIEVVKPNGCLRTEKVMETIETVDLQRLTRIHIGIVLPKEGKSFLSLRSLRIHRISR